MFKQGFDSSRQFFNLEDNVKNKYGIDHQRFHGYISSGKELFNSGGNYVTEMNLHNAGRSLQDLMSKVEISIQAAKKQELEEMNRS